MKTQFVMDTGLLYSLNMFHIQTRIPFLPDNCGKMLPKVSKAGQAKTCTKLERRGSIGLSHFWLIFHEKFYVTCFYSRPSLTT